MRTIAVELTDVLYAELEVAAAAIREHGYGVEAWATEALEAAIATRRLPHVTQGTHGPRISTPEINEEVGEVGPEECYPVHLPE